MGHFLFIPGSNMPVFTEKNIKGTTTNNAKILEKDVADVPTRKTFYYVFIKCKALRSGLTHYAFR